MEHTITPTIPDLQEQVRKLTEELAALKVAHRNEARRAEKEIIENGVLDSIIDKLIEAIK